MLNYDGNKMIRNVRENSVNFIWSSIKLYEGDVIKYLKK